jgi:uncharacterized protein (TIGR02186 family)
MIRALILLMMVALPARAEQIVAGLSQSEVSITANFTGSEIIIYGAVKRDAPAPKTPRLEVIVTVEGPATPLIIRKKNRRSGIWVNTDSVQIDLAPSFYAVATTGPIAEILSDTENLRYQITIPRAIRAIGISAEAENSGDFIAALLRIREREDRYRLAEGAVELTDATLFRADVVLPANLTEGDYRVRMYLTRGGKVVDAQDQVIAVQKQGLERFVNRLSKSQPLIYGLISLVMAVAAGWGASAAFRLLRS